MQVMDAKTHFSVANTTNSRTPAFTVTGLRPGNGYIVSVAAYNGKGQSEAMRIHAFTARALAGSKEAGPKTGESSLTGGSKGYHHAKGGKGIMEFAVTPVLGVLLAVGGALVIVFLSISVYFCIRRKPSSASNRRNNGNGGAKPRTSGSGKYSSETHVPLQKGSKKYRLNAWNTKLIF